MRQWAGPIIRNALKTISGLAHSLLSGLDYASAGHTGFEPTVTKGNLTAGAGITIGGTGTGAVIGTGASVTNSDTGSGAVATHNAAFTHSDIALNTGARHTRSHSIIGTSDHTSTATAGQMLKADANGLPVDATNTDAAVSAVVTASHARSHALDGTSDHSAGSLSASLPVFTDATPKLITKSVVDTLTALGLTNVTLAASTLTDNAVVRGDGGTRGVQTSTMVISDAGEVTNPSQPAFLVTAALQSDITGDGTTYSVVFSTEIFDQGNDFDGTSTFTAPLTGRYLLAGSGDVSGLTADHNAFVLYLISSNRNYISYAYGTAGGANPFTFFGQRLVVIADMDANDTVIFKVAAFNGAKVVDLTSFSHFSGMLVC